MDVSSWRLAPVQQRRNAIENILRMACFLCSVCLEAFHETQSSVIKRTNPNPKVRKSGAVGNKAALAQGPGFDGTKPGFFN